MLSLDRVFHSLMLKWQWHLYYVGRSSIAMVSERKKSFIWQFMHSSKQDLISGGVASRFTMRNNSSFYVCIVRSPYCGTGQQCWAVGGLTARGYLLKLATKCSTHCCLCASTHPLSSAVTTGCCTETGRAQTPHAPLVPAVSSMPVKLGVQSVDHTVVRQQLISRCYEIASP